MASTPAFASTVKAWAAWVIAAGGTTQTATITTAGLQATGNSRSGGGITVGVPTNSVSLMAAGATGSRIDEITFTALTTSSANIGRVFVYNGTNHYLYKEIAIPANTPSASNPTASVTTTFNNLVIPSGSSIYVSVATMGTTTDGGYSVTAFGGDF